MNPRIPVRHDALAHYVETSRETVLHDAKGNQLVVLNEIGAAVWLLIDNERTIDEITDIIVETLPDSSAVASDEIASFLADLEAHQLLHWQ